MQHAVDIPQRDLRLSLCPTNRPITIPIVILCCYRNYFYSTSKLRTIFLHLPVHSSFLQLKDVDHGDCISSLVTAVEALLQARVHLHSLKKPHNIILEIVSFKNAFTYQCPKYKNTVVFSNSLSSRRQHELRLVLLLRLLATTVL